jgi:hydroxyethylthiazole kinase-like sugar kinase family protein
MHYIKTSALRSLVLDVIKRVSGFVRGNEEEFARLAREASELQSAEAAKARREQLAKSQKRCAELDSLIKKLCGFPRPICVTSPLSLYRA